MDNLKVTVRRTRKFGRGVFAVKTIRKGEIIAVFDGPILEEESDGWTKDRMDHTIQFAEYRWRDSKGIARLVNHSCEPNCGIKGLFKIVAMRKIEAGEHITWDYEMTEKNLTWKMKCKCGSPICRKVIGNYANMPRRIRLKYKGYISEWLTTGRTRS